MANAALGVGSAAFDNNFAVFRNNSLTNGNNTVCTANNSGLVVGHSCFLSNNEAALTKADASRHCTCGANANSVSTDNSSACICVAGILIHNGGHNRVFCGDNTACSVMGYAVAKGGTSARLAALMGSVCGRGGNGTSFGGAVVCNGTKGVFCTSDLNAPPAFRCYYLRRS